MQVEGRLVSSIIQSFARVYTECGGKDRSILSWAQKDNFKQDTRMAGGTFSGQQETEAENNL